MKKAVFISLCFFVFCAFFAPRAFGQNDRSDSWEWYESQSFCFRQAIAEMAGFYAPKEPLIFIKELFSGFQKIGEEQNTFTTLKLRIVNNEGMVEKIISEYTTFKGYRHQCYIQKRGINFFFPSDGSFLFGVEEKTENDRVSTPAVSKTEKKKPAEPKVSNFKERERTGSTDSKKPNFSREEETVP